MTATRPLLLGALMGPIMLWMAHGPLTQGTSPIALTLFVAAHLVVALLVIAAAVFAGRISPNLRAHLSRLHRPSWRHAALMLGAAAGSAAIVHLIHGGPA